MRTLFCVTGGTWSESFFQCKKVFSSMVQQDMVMLHDVHFYNDDNYSNQYQ